MLPWTSIALTAATLGPIGGDVTDGEFGAYRGDPLLPPASALAASPSAQQSKTPGAIFVNFDGAELTEAPEDSRLNQSQIGFSGTFERYGDGPKREAVMQALAADWAAYDVELTQTRPDDGDYTMAMVGPTNFTGTSLGIALLDCGNNWTSNNIVYAFHQMDDAYSAAATATTIGQEVAHSYGLEHVDDPEDVMNPFNIGGDPGFKDECIDLIPADFGILCEEQHERECGRADQQNSHRELLDLFGSTLPDTAAPTVEIEFPLDGDVFDIGASFEVRVTAVDDGDVVRLTLLDDGSMIGDDVEAPFGWRVQDAAEGEYRLVVEAVDEAGNVGSSQEVVIAVAAGGDPGMPDDGDSADDPLEPVDGDDNGGRTTPEWDPADGSKRLRYRAIDSAGCAIHGENAPAPWGLLVLLVFLRRRR